MATDLSQFGGEGYVPTPGFDPLGRGGDRYGVIAGPPLPFENEPAAPSQTPNLAVLPELLGIYNPPPAQPISDLERIAYASPTAVRFNVQQTPAFGPVSVSGYAQPPVDPLSYYQPVAQPVPQAPANPNASTRWTDFSSIKPSTYDASPTQETPAPPSQTPAGPSLSSTGESKALYPDYPWAMPGDVIPNMGGVRAGDPFFNNQGDQYDWYTGNWIPAVKPTSPEDVAKENIQQLTPEETAKVTEGQTPTTTPEGAVVTPGKERDVAPPERVDITTPEYTPFTFTEPAPSVPIQRLPTTTTTNRRPYQTVPTLEPITVPMPSRREIEPFRTGYFRDINYDPELILAAAMRSLGPRYAKQSVIDEQRMFERMMR